MTGKECMSLQKNNGDLNLFQILALSSTVFVIIIMYS